jgi:hypothetical protein
MVNRDGNGFKDLILIKKDIISILIYNKTKEN